MLPQIAVILALSSSQALLAVNQEASGEAPPANVAETKITHTPLERAARDEPIAIDARVDDPSRLFTPLVFARKSGSARYEAFTMRERGRRGFVAVLPASILTDGSFEYFIEAQHEHGPATRMGSPRMPFTAVAYDPPLAPVPTTVRTDPRGASVRIDGNEVGRTPLTVPLLPGTHVVTVATADGRSAEQQIELKRRQRKLELDVPLPQTASGPPTLSVVSDPPSANVLVDGVVAGRTPYSGELTPGDHVVAVEAEGRLREQRKVRAREGRDASLSFTLLPLPRQAAVTVESDPSGARVLLDGKEAGRTPWVAPLPAGTHALVLKLDGRREVATEFQMAKDRDLSIRLALPPAASPARVTVTSVPGSATLTVDGKAVGVTPWSAELRPGSHKVAVAAEGHFPDERVIQVQAGRDTDVAFALRHVPGPAKLRVETDPANAVVSVDGKQTGSAPLDHDLPAGEHQLVVGLDGYKTIAQQLTVEPGQQVSLRLALQRAGANTSGPLLAIRSEPQGALVSVDGKALGATPQTVPSTPGRHVVKLTLDGYQPQSYAVTLPESRDFEMRLAGTLVPVRGVEQRPAPPTNEELAIAQVKTAYACSRQGDNDCALRAYRTAYEYMQSPRILFNIATVRRRMGQLKEAESAYRSLLQDLDKPGRKVDSSEEKIRREAKAQLASLEQRLEPKPAADKVPPLPHVAQQTDDHEPPVLVHEVASVAVRARALRLTAQISDDRSGVGLAQACWRNLFRREFQCQPMAKLADEAYAIELPASAIQEGLAYYLEAWDNADNGPARSGSPEQPNAVTVEDAPAPVLSAAVASAVTSAPPSGAAAVPASFTAAPAQANARLGALEPVERREAPGLWSVQAFAGAGRSMQDGTPRVSQAHLRVEATRTLMPQWTARATVDWRAGYQPYIPLTAVPKSGWLSQIENRIDLHAMAGYDVGALLQTDGRLELLPLAGAAFVTMRNTRFPSSMVGAAVGGRVRFALLEDVVLQGSAVYAYGLASDGGTSAAQAPHSDVSFRGGLEVLLRRGYTLDLDYDGDVFSFERTNRVVHGATLGLGKSF
jgi:hypothetical protein